MTAITAVFADGQSADLELPTPVPIQTHKPLGQKMMKVLFLSALSIVFVLGCGEAFGHEDTALGADVEIDTAPQEIVSSSSTRDLDYREGVKLGLRLNMYDYSGWTAVQILPGSPAERAGLRVGDRVLSISDFSLMSSSSGYAESVEVTSDDSSVLETVRPVLGNLAELKLGDQVSIAYEREGVRDFASTTLTRIPRESLSGLFGCYTCIMCYELYVGWNTCGSKIACKVACMIA